ncbi:MAG: CHRD domain-containing protein [Deinococcota bacterium]
MRTRRTVIGLLLALTTLALAQDGHMSEVVNPKSESEMPSPLELNPTRGQDIGSVFEAFLSPHQQGGEEEDTPRLIPAAFRSTAPSTPRNERTSRGHGVLSFTNDLSKAYVHVAVENVDLDNIVMFHIHCGRPGQLGPIIVDFGLMGDVREFWADGVFTMEITNEDIEAVLDSSGGLIGAFTAGCPIVPSIPNDRVTTIGGMETIAREGELYFNLHTAGQTYFGDIRGKLVQVE